jgi:CubicO group peptidase (beta-lactamase class C family)
MEGFGGGFPTFNRSKGSFQTLGELLTRFAGHPFDQFLHATIGPNCETNGALRHPTKVLRREC